MNAEEKQKCICTFEEYDGLVFTNIDCPVHGALHRKNPYAMPEESESSIGNYEIEDAILDYESAIEHYQIGGSPVIRETETQIAKRLYSEYVMEHYGKGCMYRVRKFQYWLDGRDQNG